MDQGDSRNNSALHYAAQGGQARVTSALLAAGANVMHRGRVGLTPLHNAASNNSLDVIRLLLDAGADIDAPRKPGDGETPLSQAAWKNKIPAIEMLVESGANIDSPSLLGTLFVVLGEKRQYRVTEKPLGDKKEKKKQTKNGH